ncbi:MAG: serine/threonine-protein phosphatase [Alphaproteobacteria bacterium]|nr:serine/threonine-protein phosphatase [Alphaproteobacteria bacterium]
MTVIADSAQPRTYGWRSWSDVAREALLAATIGISISFVESGGTKRMPDLHTVVRNVIIMICVMTVGRLLETMLSWAIEQSRVPILFRTALYAGGGWLGYLLGIALSAAAVGVEEEDFAVHSYHFGYSLLGTALGSIIVGMILHHNRKRNDRLQESIARLKEHEFAEKELEIARAMQERLLPPREIRGDGFHVSARTHAAHIVGGDFYDVIRLNDGTVSILVADVAGKGIAASLIMATCKAMIPFLASLGRPAAVMEALNEKLCGELERREFVAMVYAQLDPRSGRVEIVNAGMPEPLLLRGGGCRVITFNGDRYPLGIRGNTRYESVVVDLAADERLLLFSDGLPEAMVGDTPVGYERVESMVCGFESVDALVAQVQAIPGVRIDDDLTVLVLSR